MKRTEFAYMKKYKTKTFCIVYKWGKYFVTELMRSENGATSVAINTARRSYKTILGAERYLLSLMSACDGATKPEILYGTEDFIKKGEYLT